jgi:hypothetical protein
MTIIFLARKHPRPLLFTNLIPSHIRWKISYRLSTSANEAVGMYDPLAPTKKTIAFRLNHPDKSDG